MHTSPERPIRIAVVGAGWVGTNRHLPVLLADRRFEVVGVIDQALERAERTQAALRLRRRAGSLDLPTIDWIDEIDAITVATPPAAHAPVIDAARALGLHVLTEKPFTLDMADALRLTQPGGPVLGVMHNFAFARSAKRLWADLETGRLGQVRAISATQLSNPDRRLPTWYEELPLGLFFDESPHLLYLLRRAAPGLTLEHLDVARAAGGRQTPRMVSARYSAGDVPVTLSMNFEASVSEWHVAIHGERAIGVVDLFRDIYVRIPNDGAHTTKTVFRSSFGATAGHWAGYLTSGALHLTGRLRYGVDEVMSRFAQGIIEGHDPLDIGRADASAVRRMQQDIIDGAA